MREARSVPLDLVCRCQGISGRTFLSSQSSEVMSQPSYACQGFLEVIKAERLSRRKAGGPRLAKALP